MTRPPTAVDELRAALQMMVDGRASFPEGGRMTELYSCLEDFILQEATEFEARPLPVHTRALEPRQCFDNAIEVAVGLGLRYVEGFALARIGLPVHHAWNAPSGVDVVIDTTWTGTGEGLTPPLGRAYLGVEIPVKAAYWPREHHCTALDNWAFDWPLLKQKWTGPEGCPLEEAS